ncbi:MAG: hypothetical protein SFU85_09200 [Candidatus Methylacidiphilales bacterium]|nr:hypothetical protein [Candidatus Methylacidiphilales bacterium]
MTSQDYLAPAELYLGSDRISAAAHGPRAFRTAAKALRFAIEEAAPVSLRGARLRIGDKSFARADMLALYNSRRYPLARKNDVSTR